MSWIIVSYPGWKIPSQPYRQGADCLCRLLSLLALCASVGCPGTVWEELCLCSCSATSMLLCHTPLCPAPWSHYISLGCSWHCPVPTWLATEGLWAVRRLRAASWIPESGICSAWSHPLDFPSVTASSASTTERQDCAGFSLYQPHVNAFSREMDYVAFRISCQTLTFHLFLVHS